MAAKESLPYGEHVPAVVNLPELTNPQSVRKRDGTTTQAFDAHKIHRAIQGAWIECRKLADETAIATIRHRVLRTLPPGTIDVEQIQDAVEICLMKAGYHDVAKAFILYRKRRAEARAARRGADPAAIADYTVLAKYARFDPLLGRRELYPEVVQRVEAMHLRRFPELGDEIRWAFDFVRTKRVLPSMRSMQFGGIAIEKNHNRLYNCSFALVDRPRVFAEALYLLLCGCGVGYSVQFEHVDKLPKLKYVDEKQIVHHTIGDSIEGWADALDELIQSYIHGYYVEFNYSAIRPEGSPLRTSGGKAPGHMKLKQALERIRGVLQNAQGRRLRPIECHDMMCHAADAVLSGGIRRSAMIALFSPEDSEMIYAKTGDWWKDDKTPWRANANNSVLWVRGETNEKQFKRTFEMIREWGEPGFVFANHRDYGTNPCSEIGLNPVLEVTKELAAKYGVSVGTHLTGWAFCNLCEINAAAFETAQDFEDAAKAATLIGTLQASYTDMPYLGWVSEEIARRDALLGISMTGMLDRKDISCDPLLQEKVAKQIVEWNRDYAARIGINPAARTTCVKPAGTSSLALGAVASGHHAHHARRYFRRVTANENETVFQHFRAKNPHMCIKKRNGDWLIEFVVQAPEGAILKEDISAIEFLEMVKSTQRHWVQPGTAREDDSPGLSHNVSNTVQVQDHEWDQVADYLWHNRRYFTGVSLLPATGDKLYANAPFEAVTTEADEARWNQILANYQPVDYSTMIEEEDTTNLAGEAACAGGACAI